MRHALILAIGLIFSKVAAASLSSISPTLTDLDGQAAEFKTIKNKALVAFWATWCTDCRSKLRTDLPKLKEHPDVAVITINTEADSARVKAFAQREGISLPVFLDPKKDLRGKLEVFGVPHWAVYQRSSAQDDWRLVDHAPAFDRERIDRALGLTTAPIQATLTSKE